ncbi:conserved hypothetical protein [Aspergillus terreus NIH2624]|uniref:VOC domain-containing protein n=1 Tax=Aspergillus terreus (strain NIH 2624 / FGSC A1156) TaxID=341663 RepID=Q0CBR6_ASPTN|nr:uncharacterized protein ATEG_08868 [Aspergillus terreus NIH2624]EAU31000.1 conserved hypothetical protein [Aspergillus terreus NIH2624]
MPVSHLTLTVAHLPTSTSFFLSCLQPLGYKFIGRHDDYIGFGQHSGEPADFWITEQKPGVPAGAAHVAFPAPSKDAVGAFFISALKAGGKIHGEPKTRDSDSGYYSAAVIDFDGNSVEAVYRPGLSSARSEVSRPALALLENAPASAAGSVVSKATSVSATSKASSVRRSEARSAVSRAPTEHHRGLPAAPSTTSTSTRSIQQQPPPQTPTYVVHTTQKSDDGTTAKTIVGTLIGAAAGAAIAYAMSKGDADSSESHHPPSTAPPQYSPPRIPPAHHRPTAPWACSKSTLRAFEAPAPPGSTLLRRQQQRAPAQPPAARDIPLRAIEYPPPLDGSAAHYPCDRSTLISSFPEKSRAFDGGSVYSSSTIKASKANGNYSQTIYEVDEERHSHTSRRSSATSHRSSRSHAQSHAGGSSASRSPRHIPLPESVASYRSATKSGVSAREVPLPESVYEDAGDDVGPEDSISQIGGDASSRRSSHSHRSRASKHSHVSINTEITLPLN